MSPKLRLSGAPLSALLQVAESPLGPRLVTPIMRSNFGIERMLALPVDARALLDTDPRPRSAGTRRAWGEEAELPGADPARVTAAAIGEALSRKTTTSREMVLGLIDRVESRRFGCALHSPFIETDFDRALREAEASDRRRSRGRARGPLDGVPVPVKDELDMAGLPTRGGTSYVNIAHAEDSFVADRLRKAGAILFAKTHTTEWGMDPCGYNPHWDMPHNIYRPDRAAGGSSTGTAVSVGLGFAPVGVGSDGGGSIRIPASNAGLFGIKPTFGRMSRRGNLFGASTVAVTGPIGQSTADLVELLHAACGVPDPEDPVTSWSGDHRDLRRTWGSALRRSVRGCRIGVPAREWQDADPRVAEAGMAALRQLEARGAQLVDIHIRYAEHALAMGVLAIGPETMGNLFDDQAMHGRWYSRSLRVTLAILRSLRAHEYLAAARARAALRRAVAEALRDVDVFAMPTCAQVAPQYLPEENRADITDDDALRGMTRFAFLANLTGLPAGTAPTGLVDGLPTGIQFVADAWDEAAVFTCLAECERAEFTRIGAPPAYERLV